MARWVALTVDAAGRVRTVRWTHHRRPGHGFQGHVATPVPRRMPRGSTWPSSGSRGPSTWVGSRAWPWPSRVSRPQEFVDTTETPGHEEEFLLSHGREKKLRRILAYTCALPSATVVVAWICTLKIATLDAWRARMRNSRRAVDVSPLAPPPFLQLQPYHPR